MPDNVWWQGLRLNAEGARDLSFLEDLTPTFLSALSVEDSARTAVTDAEMVHLAGLVSLEIRCDPKPRAADVTEYRSRVLPIFARRMEKLADVFPVGHVFLRDLGDNRIPSFYLWTATNAHLYYKDGYFCYLVPDKNELKMRGRFHTRIKSGATDNHELAFSTPLRGLISGLDGFKEG
ncbi:MAG: hypothetical protein ACYC5Q_05645 [Thermoleophilia bacterium]